MDSVETVAFGAVCAAAGSLATGYVLSTIDHRREMRDAGRIEVERKRRLDGYESAGSLAGMLAELEHSVTHIWGDTTNDAINAYANSAARTRREIRASARAAILVIGPDTVTAINTVTDHAQEFIALMLEARQFKSLEDVHADSQLGKIGRNMLAEIWDLRGTLASHEGGQDNSTARRWRRSRRS